MSNIQCIKTYSNQFTINIYKENINQKQMQYTKHQVDAIVEEEASIKKCKIFKELIEIYWQTKYDQIVKKYDPKMPKFNAQ